MLLGPSLLRGRDSDGFPKYQEKFIRDCIRKFPYCEATLLQQLVRSTAATHDFVQNLVQWVLNAVFDVFRATIQQCSQCCPRP